MQSTLSRSVATRRLVIAGGALTLSVLSCGREPTAPSGPQSARFSHPVSWLAEFPTLLPAFQAAGGTGVAFTKVRIVLNNPDGTVALDTVVNFPANADELTLTLAVPLPASAPATGQPLALNLKYVNAAGDTVFKGGPVTIVAVPATPGAGPPPPTPVTIPIAYTGPGAQATSVRISPKTLTVNTGATFNFSAEALDATGNVIPNTPIVFVSQNTGLATISAATGAGTAGAARGTVTIAAQLLTGPTDAATLTILSPPSLIAAVSGGSQTAPVSTTLPQPIVVQVNATDGLPAAGVNVTFAAQNGGSVGSGTVATDANGRAQTTWRLGPAAGQQTLTASATGLTGSPVTFNATARAVDPVRLSFTTQPPSSTAAGVTMSPAIAVAAVDATGAVTTPFTGAVSVALGAGAPATVRLTGTTTVNAVAGIATFGDLKVNAPGTYTLVATSGSLASSTSSSFQIVAGNASTLSFQGYPVAGSVAGAVMDDITVFVRDNLGNNVTTFTGEVSLVANGPNPVATEGGTQAAAGAEAANAATANSLIGTTRVNAVAGVATFSGLRLTAAGSYTLSASASGLAGTTGPAFVLSAGPASVLSLVSGGGQSAAGAVPLANPIVVKVSDGFGNGIAGVTVSFSPPVGNGTANPASAVSSAEGLAQTTWTLLGTSGAKTLNVTGSGLLPNPLVVTATATTSSGTARVWTGAASASFTDPNNWSPAGAPGPADPLTVTSAGNAPVISAPTTIGSLSVADGVFLTNNSTLTIGGSMAAGNGASLLRSPEPRVQRANAVTGSGTIILNGVSGTVSGFIGGNVTIAGGSYTLNGYTAVSGNVVIATSGTLEVAEQTLFVSGDLSTATGGRLAMTNASGSVHVTGNANFGGGATFGLLTAGMLTVERNFTANGTSFAATGTHVLRLFGNNEGTDGLAFTSPVGGRGINTLILDGFDEKVMSGAPQIMGSVVVNAGSGAVTGAVTVRIGGDLSDATSGFGTVGAWQVANTDFFGTSSINVGYLTSNVTISGGTVSIVTVPCGECIEDSAPRASVLDHSYLLINGSVNVTGSSARLNVNGSTVYIDGNLSTASGGKIQTTTADDAIYVAGNATFAGGSTAGLLSGGFLTVEGNFSQGGGAADAFAPSPGFFTRVGAFEEDLLVQAQVRSSRPGGRRLSAAQVAVRDAQTAKLRERAAVFAGLRAKLQATYDAAYARRGLTAPRLGTRTRAGSGGFQRASSLTPSVVSFANPGFGAGTSQFGALEIVNHVFASNVFAHEIYAECGYISGTGQLLTTNGVYTDCLGFSNVRWELRANGPMEVVNGVSFTDMSSTVDQFTIIGTGVTDPPDFHDWSFDTTPTTGNYMRAVDTAPGDENPLVVSFVGVSPAAHGGKIALDGGATTNWPAVLLATWTGASECCSWNEPGNWDINAVPNENIDVLIPDIVAGDPYLTGPAKVRNITIDPAASLQLDDNLEVFGNVVTSDDGGFQCGESGGAVIMKGAGKTAVGRFCSLTIAAGASVTFAGDSDVDEDLSVLGILTLGGEVIVVDRQFATSGSGTIVMSNADDILIVWDATFGGGNSTLTAGELWVMSSLTASAANAFATSGAHETITDPYGPWEFEGNKRLADGPRFGIGGGTVPGSAAGRAASPAQARALARSAAQQAARVAAAKQRAEARKPLISARLAWRDSLEARRVNRKERPGTPERANERLGTRANAIGTSGAPRARYSESYVDLVFANTTGNRFTNLTVYHGMYVNTELLATTVDLGSTANVYGTGNLIVTGALGGHEYSYFAPDQVELRGSLPYLGSFSPGLTVWSGTNQFMPAQNAGGYSYLNYQDVRVTGTGLRAYDQANSYYIDGNLEIAGSGQLRVGDASAATYVYIGEDLTTTGSGTLQMTDHAETYIEVYYGSANFGGGSTSGLLTMGELYIGGDFSQSGNALAYAPSPGHRTNFGGITHNVAFANPGFGASRFGDLVIEYTSLAFSTDAFVGGMLLADNGEGSSQVYGANTLLTVNGAHVTSVYFHNKRLAIVGSGTITDLSYLRFYDMTPTSTYFSLARTGAGGALPTFYGWTFGTTPSGAGKYLEINDTNGATDGVLTVTMNNVDPGGHGGAVTLLGGALLNGWDTLAPADLAYQMHAPTPPWVQRQPAIRSGHSAGRDSALAQERR